MLSGKEESASETTTLRDSGRTSIAVDLAKSVLGMALSKRPGQVRPRRRLSCSALLEFLAQQPAATVPREACSNKHFWAREIESLGHTKAAVALANRLARYAWAVATWETQFEVRSLAA
jgi:hypothetical protein